MPLTLENSPELTGVLKMAGPRQMVRVLRAFRLQGSEPIAPGSVIDLDRATAVDLRTAGKVEFVANDEKRRVDHDVPKAPRPGQLQQRQDEKYDAENARIAKAQADRKAKEEAEAAEADDKAKAEGSKKK